MQTTAPLTIFLINLERRPDRLAAVSQQLQQLGLSFERIHAVDGSQLPQPYPLVATQRFLLEQKKPIVPGEIGCAESHRTIWKLMLERRLDYALVLEDDILIDPALGTWLHSGAYQGQDLVNLSATEPYRVPPETLEALLAQGILHRPSPLSPWRQQWKALEWRRKWRIFQLHPQTSTHTLCEADPAPALGSGYVLSARAAAAFLKHSDPLFFPIDLVWRYSAGLLRQSFLVPSLVQQRLGDSDIPGRYAGYRLSTWQSIQRFFVKSRRLRRRLDLLRLYGLRLW